MFWRIILSAIIRKKQLHNFQSVLIADQKDVLAYLTGKQETSQYLVSVEELTTIVVPQPSEAPGSFCKHSFFIS